MRKIALLGVFMSLGFSPALAGTVQDPAYYQERARYIALRSPVDAMADGEYLFMSSSVPEQSWRRYMAEAKGRSDFRGFVLRGFTEKQVKEIKKQAIAAQKRGEKPEPPAWVAARPDIEPAWFRMLDIRRVPAFVVKRGNEACIAFGDNSMDVARAILRQKGCAFLARESR